MCTTAFIHDHYLACFSEHAAALTEAQFRKAIELDPHSVDAHLNLGLAMATQNVTKKRYLSPACQ